MFITVKERTGKIYYFPVTEISYIVEELDGCTIVMKNGDFYHIYGELFFPSTN